MYHIMTVEGVVKVPPSKFTKNLKETVYSSLVDELEGKIDPNFGVILAVTEVEEIGEGKIMPGEGNIYYNAKFKILTFKPELHEVVEGEVVDAMEFGAFIRIGPLDGLVHISQMMNDFVSFDSKNNVFSGRQTKKILKVGDKVRARIISISWKEQNKIGLTMRQPGLGSLNWLEEEKKRKKA